MKISCISRFFQSLIPIITRTNVRVNVIVWGRASKSGGVPHRKTERSGWPPKRPVFIFGIVPSPYKNDRHRQAIRCLMDGKTGIISERNFAVWAVDKSNSDIYPLGAYLDKSTLLTRQCSPKKRDNASRVFSLGFVMGGRSFLFIDIEKGQSISRLSLVVYSLLVSITYQRLLLLHRW